jgi:hypothetical protein
MSAPPNLPEKPTPEDASRGGIDIHGGDVRAARDIVAGDVNVAGDSISGQTVSVQQGFSANQVQRLVLIVGGLVFVTAACFFIFGAISAAALVNTLNRPLTSSDAAAASMQNKIDAMNALQPGQEFQVVFTEDEISSYFRFVVGPAIGISDGKARLTGDPGKIAIGGNLDSAGGLPFIGELTVTNTDVPFSLTGAWVKILPTPEGVSFGWVPVTPLAQNLSNRLNALLFGNVRFTELRQSGGGVRPPTEAGGNRIILSGVAK